MVNINFVPDDYTQSNESRRTNLIYLVLFAVVMIALGSSFVSIKIRQRACYASEELINARMTEIKEAIKKFEELQTKKREMMKTALTTAELLEPVPRSILLASLTNNLPVGVSLSEVKLVQKQSKQNPTVAKTSKYQAAQGQKAASQSNGSQQAAHSQSRGPENPEKLLETHIDIGGLAPSDLQVASYIEQLSNSSLLDNVALVESKEFKFQDSTLRQFKLSAMLRKNVHLTKEDIEGIKDKAENTIWNF
ncbi:MAG TPA: PilN domain-containing protein [Sedimentisphaerales bacterium]|nr:PilN domain-containing protein [Sedimentisphaerales bacterium]